LISGSALGLFILFKHAEAVRAEGNIVALEPLIYGQCTDGACLQNTEVTAFVDFKNIGRVYKENTVGINVNGIIVKEMPVGLNPGTGFTMSYTFNISPGANNICGVVR
jgi:hypothetical protein